MAKRSDNKTDQPRKMPPAKTPEARENQLIALAVDLAEKQIRDGTATSQIITHFLKLGSMKDKIEVEILEKKKDLITAKTDQIKSQKKIQDLYEKALSAMRVYSGSGDEEVFNED